MNNPIVEKSLAFAIRIVKLYNYLRKDKKEYIMSEQLLKCGTSIGANVTEAQHGQSKNDFATKMNIALKEAGETIYWLTLLYKTDYITEEQYKSMETDAKELNALLVSICKKVFNNQ